MSLVFADSAGSYWFAGILTAVSALIVIAVMLATSASKSDEPS